MAGGSTSGPGAIRVVDGVIEINADRTDDERIELTSSTPATGRCRSDRTCTCRTPTRRWSSTGSPPTGFRLDIPSGTSRRFEPGASSTVAAVALRGRREVPGIALRSDVQPAERISGTGKDH